MTMVNCWMPSFSGSAATRRLMYSKPLPARKPAMGKG
jgi:hypothetical protein